jgi:hypothetical protein
MWGRRLGGWIVIASCACGRFGFHPLDDARPPGDDARVETFGTPQLLFALPAGANGIDDPTLTSDLLEMYFELAQGETSDIYMVTRASVTSPWSAPVVVVEVSDPVQYDTNPELSADGLTLRVSHPIEIPPRVRQSVRADRGAPWSALVEIGVRGHGFTSDATDTYGVVHRDSANGNKLWSVERPTAADPWWAGTQLAELASPSADDTSPWISPDGLVLYFESNVTGNGELYVATRPSRSDPFGPAFPIAELNTTGYEGDPWLSPDLRTIVFASDRGGQVEFYIAQR